MNWDVKKESEIPFFDPTLSYELTKYRPINKEQGLDFKPEWFTQTRDVKLETGKYCSYPRGTKKYIDFWKEQFERCREGYEVNGYRITGDHYFFLNFYQLPASKVKKTGQGRGMIFPTFAAKQYEYFHYIELCEYLSKDVCAVKARGVGFSEIAASLGVCSYTTRKGTHNVYVGFTEKYVSDVLDKAWFQLENLNTNTEDGMKHVRQKYNSAWKKKASKVNKQREEIPDSWNSDIEGIVVDNPRKLRGDRIDRLFFEESGSNPNLIKTYLQSSPLVNILGDKVGTRIVWGTGGDSAHMSQLEQIFWNPEGFNILPYRHCYTESKEYALTGFFIPAYSFLLKDGFVDERGVTDEEKAKQELLNDRNKLSNNPKAYIIQCAEYCFTPEEAFSLEGDNMFDKLLIANQRTAIKLGYGPKEQIGTLNFTYNGPKVEENIDKVVFKPDLKGKVHILELPETGEEGQISKNLYVAGIDGIDMGQEDTSEATRDPSCFCVVVFRRLYGTHPPQIVAYYKDRPNHIETAHEMCYKLLKFYNAQACLESTRISLLQYFRSKRCENKYLMRRPRSCQSDIQRGNSRQFGAPASEHVIKHQLELIQNYINDYCQEIWFEEVLKELGSYSYEEKRKFDIVAALGMALLADEELMFVSPKIEKETSNSFQNFGYWKDEYGRIHKGVIPKERYSPKPIWQVTHWEDESYGYERLRRTSTIYN